ncbi:iron ABC transporter permease [Rhodoferax sp. TBRC 17660]|uniref:Iron ABC transporter permease n=1 Tax=Rhodoferax potami TaxID=3068338 RepID=A0ABU3KJV4_9BURK|nr:iron ABC transporter permease [Rhodoferax sp. TBRC 17660]MDT7518026.1 iron ABC transporter permease [Rhodoferax sp. TBRC 17660]
MPPRFLPSFASGIRALPAHLALWLIGGLVSLPILALVVAVLQWDAQSAALLREMAGSVLGGYAFTTVVLSVVVSLGVAVVGTACACAVTLFDFRGRKQWEWALLLPLAMPAYVVAYAYTDYLQFSGPAQTWLRSAFGLEGRVLPEVRSLGGAALVFVCTLYPYVYLLVRVALLERAAHLMDAARLMGASLGRRVATIAVPLARPSIMAGVALALMETLADYGVSSYFGIQTFTAGIYKAWLVLDSRIAAAQLATALLVLMALLLRLELHARQRMRYASVKGRRAAAQPVALTGVRALLATGVCALPVLLGFVLPVLFMLRPLWQAWGAEDTPLPWGSFIGWSLNSFKLAACTAVLAAAIALALAFAARRTPTRLTRTVVSLAGMGYAVPGAVIVVGLLIPVGWLQAARPDWQVGFWISTTVLGVVWAYLVRFTAVALHTVQSGYNQVPASLDETARMLGVSGWGLWWRVHRPLLVRSSLVAGLLVFVDVMKELPATLVLRPFDHDTLAVVAFQLAKDERLGEAALPALVLVLVGLVPVILLSRTLNKKTA